MIIFVTLGNEAICDMPPPRKKINIRNNHLFYVNFATQIRFVKTLQDSEQQQIFQPSIFKHFSCVQKVLLFPDVTLNGDRAGLQKRMNVSNGFLSV